MNGLEEEYYPQDTDNGVQDYLTAAGQIDMEKLLHNFRDFIVIPVVQEMPSEARG